MRLKRNIVICNAYLSSYFKFYRILLQRFLYFFLDNNDHKDLYDKFKQSYNNGKIIAQDVYFFKKLKWSKEKLKKYIRNTDVKFH